MFSEAEEKAIQEKLDQLTRVKDGTSSPEELSDLITERRVGWIEEHLDEMLDKYNGLSPEERAHRIVFLEHMVINPEHSKVERVSPGKIRIYSYNFCPYLEACNKLGLDTRFVCREIGEPSLQETMRRIDPGLRFSRNYTRIRPYIADFCEEYIENSRPGPEFR